MSQHNIFIATQLQLPIHAQQIPAGDKKKLDNRPTTIHYQFTDKKRKEDKREMRGERGEKEAKSLVGCSATV